MIRHRRINNWISSFLFFLIMTTSCHKNTFFHSFQPVEPTGWDKNDTLSYSLPNAIIGNSYQYEIGIRHKDSYNYRDIWLTINQDTIHLYLADSIGNWIGNGIGEIRQMTFPIQINPSPKDSIKEFHITHIMQDNPICGIQDIGLKIMQLP